MKTIEDKFKEWFRVSFRMSRKWEMDIHDIEIAGLLTPFHGGYELALKEMKERLRQAESLLDIILYQVNPDDIEIEKNSRLIEKYFLNWKRIYNEND